MSETAAVAGTSSEGKTDSTPPQDLPLNLDLYNYDTPDAQACPYVLTSPRSLEACSRVGVKPVDLLHKTLAEFSEDIEEGKPLEEVFKLYDEHEQHRIIMLEKCQAERDFIIWRTTSKRRSQSLSPCRREKLYSHQSPEKIQASPPRNINRKTTGDILSSPETPDGRQSRLASRQSRRSSVKNSNKGQRPTSWSTPASPYYRGSHNLFVRITSPVVCAKLQNFPRAKMRLPPKDMKILEVILQKYERQEEEEERKARAQRAWDREKEERERKKEVAELERWKFLASKQKRSSSEERLKQPSGKERNTSNHCCSKQLGSPQEEGTKTPSMLWKRHSFKSLRNQKQIKSFEEQARPKQAVSAERMSRYEIEQKLRAIKLKEERFEKRKQELLQKRDSIMKRSAEELREKIKQVKLNQQELDKAMEKWQQQVVCYQQSSNRRAAEKVAERVEQRRMKAKQERMTKQAEHKKKMQRIEAEDYAKLQEMMAKLRSKDERCRAFAEEKNSSIEQSRQLAQAASDLRDLIRQRLDKDSFLRRSKHVLLESRLQQMEPRFSLPKKQEHSSEQC